ncbi:dihydrolipoamide acetyltransferase family protein [Luteipulveratus flavus]|uniref:Dihydrolipoamide acetyltransferase component of pyruvate dehydrogenase complex n=1 Tax=Luteipulveratus flavus TaxID=3031728 RepID=A0ABT6C1M6_9MICO|nr:dihydrolipoamide acetyltransferase family protein [Luteipulveratus sp. YIM 133296]MDF8262771.1 dihydrolipoamide acetyltransferase family protein [Luteipulveratus sp. YIM 133296]
MAVKQFNLPDPGEGLVEAEIVTWKVKAGDTVKTNDIVVEIETAKSLVELPIPWEGTVVELLVEEGTTVDVGAPIVSVDVAGAEGDPADGSATDLVPDTASGSAAGGEERVANLVGYGPSAGTTTRRKRRPAAPAAAAAPEPAGRGGEPPRASRLETSVAAGGESPSAAPGFDTDSASAPSGSTSGGGAWSYSTSNGRKALAKPPVRKFAKDRGVDLSQVIPTREDGVISRADVEAFIADGPSEAAAPAANVDYPALHAVPGSQSSLGGGERETRIPVKGVRKMTAQAMVGSAFTAPHVTEFITIDVTRTMELVERLKADREFRDVKVTPLLVLAKALCIAIRRNPGMNATWDEQAQEIIQKNYVNLGIAAATPRGLLVPNIKDAQTMDLRQLAEAIGALTTTAREGRTQPAEMSGGTITITNVGVFGVDTGTPIINPGESAIVCFGAIRKQPWVVTDADGNDELAIRQVTQLSVSFDHRLIDGELGSRFLADVAAVLEDPSRGLVWG